MKKNSKTYMHPDTTIQNFRAQIYAHYQQHARDFSWRQTTDPYRIMVSEIMLQQTQTSRVVEKYELFTTALPTFEALAQAPLRQVLQLWQGLGYNRRGMYLHQAAQRVVAEFGGKLPDDPEVLKTLPGIGPNTAGSICAFAFNKPVVFIETNIRSVFLHHFFKGRAEVTDRELMPIIAQALDVENARHWYYALMDYGVMLKKQLVNPSRRSKHHVRQSKFEGSERQIRGMIVRLLGQHVLTAAQLCLHIEREPARVKKNLAALCVEGLVVKQGRLYSIPD
jgi:A/G-specific adenine glycosylase